MNGTGHAAVFRDLAARWGGWHARCPPAPAPQEEGGPDARDGHGPRSVPRPATGTERILGVPAGARRFVLAQLR